jgi:hypothetical protein
MCGKEGRRVWPKLMNVGTMIGFRSGYDVFAGATFETDRQRNNYIANKGLRKLYKKPHGDIVKKI